MFYYLTVDTPLGPLTLAEDHLGIFMLNFGEADLSFFESVAKLTKLKDGRPGGNHTHCLAAQLQAFFEDRQQTFEIPLSLYGTAFRKSVWEQIATVPYGTLISYGDLSKRIGNPKASRAVGGATGKNPIPIIIPCHRIVGSSGALTGFSAPGGLNTKIKLLALEGIHYEI